VRNKTLGRLLECQQVADDILMARTVLRAMPRHSEVSAPWFAPRVMAADLPPKNRSCANSGGLGAVPRFAARLTGFPRWRLLLAHLAVQIAASGAERRAELPIHRGSLFDSPQSSATDDVLPAEKRMTEKGRHAQAALWVGLVILLGALLARVGLPVCASPVSAANAPLSGRSGERIAWRK